ncbi:MAG: thiamine ABC transporter substrate-binding protein [Thermoleophilia bacterium]|nr:thiamine ABC transporter substrate-binding protein [Thermoleophilia bacterium]
MTICHKVAVVLAVLTASLVAGCGDSGDSGEPTEVVLVTHDSFAIPKQVKASFEQESGFTLRILQGGDAGETVNRALLTKGNPQGDVLFGIDSNLLSRALDEELFEPYEATGLDEVEGRTILDPTHRVTPVDQGDVCLNVDRKWFASRRMAPPTSLDDLTAPRYRKLLVVQNPATSTPGLAFMLATVARFGEGGWRDYWRGLRANDALVVDGWEEAYTQRFSGAGGSKGTRPIVVSYATSPAAEVMFATKPSSKAPTAVVSASCFRQIEFAGVLDGAKNVAGAHALIDFMLSEQFQAALPESMFVLPVRSGTPLPDAFRRYAASPPDSLELPAATIGENRDRWLDEWTQTVLR